MASLGMIGPPARLAALSTLQGLTQLAVPSWGWAGGQTFKVKILCYYIIGPYFCPPPLTSQHMLLIWGGNHSSREQAVAQLLH